MNARNSKISPDAPVDELRVIDARFAVAAEVGFNHTPRTGFGKLELNSIHAYLTGSFAFEKRVYNTSNSPDIGDLRALVAAVAGIGTYEPPREYHRDELRLLADTIRNTGDNR